MNRKAFEAMSLAQAEPPVSKEKPAPAAVNLTKVWQRYRYEADGSRSEEELLREYLPLVRTVVGRMAISLPPQIEMEDLYSAGLVGLLSALRNFDPTNGATFEAYARIRVRGAVLDEFRRLDWVPRSVHAKAKKIQAAQAELETKEGRVPSDTQMARHLGITLKDYQKWLVEIRPTTFVCLDASVDAEGDSGATLHEAVADEKGPDTLDRVSRRELIRLVTDRIDHLPEVQRKVLALYYHEGLRLREIAEAFGVTESRICQIHTQAILSLKSFLRQREAVA